SRLAGDAVSNVTVADGGFGYQTPPTVTFSGGGGTGATGTAILTDGVVTGVTITDGGSGYTSPPTVTFSSPASLPLAFPNGNETDALAQGLSISVGNSTNPIASLTGDFSFSKFTDGNDTYLAIGADSVTAAVAAGSVSVTVTGASLGLPIDTSAPDNYALVALGGTDSLNGVTGLTLTGNDLSLQVRNGIFPSTLLSTVPAGVFTTDVSGDFSN